jgi:hypothetical protein
VRIGPPADTFGGAGGESKARLFEVFGYGFLARKRNRRCRVRSLSFGPRSVLDMHPGQVLLGEHVPCRLKFGGAVERADIEMRFGRKPGAFAGQGRPAPGAKTTTGPPRRGVEFCDFAFGDDLGRAFKGDKHRSRRAAMPAAALAMAPIDPFRLTRRRKADGAAQAATFELVSRAGH